MRLGIFGGAFNPVHNGHIKLAKSYLEDLSLDKLLLIPTANPPHKTSKGLAEQKHRLNMLRLAFNGIDNIEVSDIEFKRVGKSYTYNTVKEIRALYGDVELFLIIGDDQFLSFDKWYRYKELLDEAVLCTAAREPNKREKIIAFANSLLGDSYAYHLADFEPIVVSSSEIRKRLANGEDASQLLPEAVYYYIRENGLYSES